MDKIAICTLIGLTAGILSGFLGVGGGVIIIPALVFFLGFSQHLAQGTSLAVLLPPIGLLAVFEYYRHGNIDIKVAMIICAGFLLGGLAGAYFANQISSQMLKKIFGFFLFLISLHYLFGK